MSDQTYQQFKNVLDTLDNEINSINQKIDHFQNMNYSGKSFTSVEIYDRKHVTAFLQSLTKLVTLNMNFIESSKQIITYENQIKTKKDVITQKKEDVTNQQTNPLEEELEYMEQNYNIFKKNKQLANENKTEYQKYILDTYQSLFPVRFWNTYGLKAIEQPDEIEDLKSFFSTEASYA